MSLKKMQWSSINVTRIAIQHQAFRQHLTGIVQKKYATRNGTQDGIVYKLDRSKLPKYGIKEYVVKDYTNFPHIPEDDEVILVHEDHGNLPKDIIVEIIEVNL
jgi:hypothetical protein